MPTKVVDASALAAWCFREPRASEALDLLQDSDLYALLLLAYELTSIAQRKVTAYPERLAVLSKALETAFALPIHWSNVDPRAVLCLALDSNLTTYDASCLYLAQAMGVPLATFDQQLGRAAQET